MNFKFKETERETERDRVSVRDLERRVYQTQERLFFILVEGLGLPTAGTATTAGAAGVSWFFDSCCDEEEGEGYLILGLQPFWLSVAPGEATAV